MAQTVQTTDSAHPGQTQVSTHGATYDARDQQSGETADGVVTAYGYDAVGQRRTQSLLAGVITRTLDTAGRVTEIDENADGTGPYSSVYSNFDRATGQALTFQLGDGVAGLRAFDGANRPTGVSYYNVSGPNPNTALTYDGAGRVNSTTTLSGTDSLGYDGANRLTSETEQPGSTQVIAKGGAYHWSYDGNGNIQTATDDTGATDLYTYSVSIPNELTQMGATGDPLTKTTAYSYDGSGNVTSIANTAPANDKNALVQHLSYDGQGRVNQVTYLDHSNGNTTTTITIGYNADGQRSDYTFTPQGQPTLDTQFQYRNGQLAQQRVISNTTANGPVVIYTNTYLYGPQGEPLELLHAQPGQTVARYWYILDGQGSVVALTDANGSVVDRYAYDSWGESTSDDRTNEHVPQQLRYKAQYYDEKLTWYWRGGRYYDPETERYLQPDDLRSYTYANDSPLDNVAALMTRVHGINGVGRSLLFDTGASNLLGAVSSPSDFGGINAGNITATRYATRPESSRSRTTIIGPFGSASLIAQDKGGGNTLFRAALAFSNEDLFAFVAWRITWFNASNGNSGVRASLFGTNLPEAVAPDHAWITDFTDHTGSGKVIAFFKWSALATNLDVASGPAIVIRIQIR